METRTIVIPNNLWRAIQEAALDNSISNSSYIRLVLAEKLGISLEEPQLNIINSKKDLLKDNSNVLNKIRTIVKEKEQDNLPIESRLLKIINKEDKTYIERKLKVEIKQESGSFEQYLEVIYPTDDGKLKKKEYEESEFDSFVSFGVKLGFSSRDLNELTRGKQKEVGYKKTFVSIVKLQDDSD